jgi:predicted house-cleaning noncanonical NTP pyrophosphatase (MazG superfamily)
MAPLNYDEQARVDEYNDALQRRANGEMRGLRGEFLNDAWMERLRTIAENMERNAEARERRQAELKAEREAQQAKAQKRRDEEAEAAVASYRIRARAAFVGTTSQFEQEWPAILSAWQRQQVQDSLDRTIQQKRAQMGNIF